MGSREKLKATCKEQREIFILQVSNNKQTKFITSSSSFISLDARRTITLPLSVKYIDTHADIQNILSCKGLIKIYSTNNFLHIVLYIL